MERTERLHRLTRTLQWQRGLRAGVAVFTAMVVCHLLKQPMGWAALGGFEAVLVDNGGPYRTRLITMSTVLLGGALGGFLGSMTPGFASFQAMVITMLMTAAFCFSVTFARVMAQPIASTSVIILVIYFVGLGGGEHEVHGALINLGLFLAGGVWAATLSLGLWPVDPFRPARLGVAACFQELHEFTATVADGSLEDTGEAVVRQAHEWQRRVRVKMEAARNSLAATPARAPARTVTAHSLTVLLETADMMFVRTLRLAEIVEVAHDSALRESIAEMARWLTGAERAIELELRQRPADGGASFCKEGSHWLEYVDRRRRRLESQEEEVAPRRGVSLGDHLAQEARGALQEVEIAFEAACTLWTGVERPGSRTPRANEIVRQDKTPGWIDALQANWSLSSLMMRHALRVALVGAADIGLMHVVQVNHGFWLAMTSIIVLQPYGGSTMRISLQRVGGTIAGGILAALLALLVRDPAAIIATIAICAALTLATYAVDYGLYCFFLTPTFVLLSLPHPRDWYFAGVRMGTTVLGAAVSVIAMRLLWPERTGLELGRLLGRGAKADAAYIRTMVGFWALPESRRGPGERTTLAPARRACGLASNDAEEAVDRMMQEPGFSRLGMATETWAREHALTFTTYLRRLTQSVTTLAAIGRSTTGSVRRMEALATRLEELAGVLTGEPVPPTGDRLEAGSGLAIVDPAEEQMQRMERQVRVLERAGRMLRQGVRP